MRTRIFRNLCSFGCGLGLAFSGGSYAANTSAPLQPLAGPGGSNYSHQGVKIFQKTHQTSHGLASYVVYEPAMPRPTEAPVFVFLMGNFAPLKASISHHLYSAFYTHLARKGYIVIHPDNYYNAADSLTKTPHINNADDILAEVIEGAFIELQSNPTHIKPAVHDRGINWAIGGHSIGGMFAQLIANQASQFRLSYPRALLLMDSTDRGVINPNPQKPLAAGNLILPDKWEAIPKSTLVLQLRTQDSSLDTFGLSSLEYNQRLVWLDAEIRRMFRVPNENFSYGYIQKDRLKTSQLFSTHYSVMGTISMIANGALNSILKKVIDPLFSPYTISDIFRLDTTDYYGIWKPTVALLDFSLKQEKSSRKFAFPSSYSRAFNFMGTWGNGKRVKEILTVQEVPTWRRWFDNTQKFAPCPELPTVLHISGYPKIVFTNVTSLGTATAKVIFSNYGSRSIKIISSSISGASGSSFGFAAGTQVEVGSRLDLEFNPKTPGVHLGVLEVDYEIDGKLYRAQRELEGYLF